MKLYVKAFSTYRGDLNKFDVKKELKQRYKRDTRRQDRFIHLALYGALQLKERVDISMDDELYITSGVGNIDVVQKANTSVNEEKDYLKPFDFINLLGNTTSYHVATALGMKGKNIFQISNNFTFINSLISIYASLNISKKEAVLGSVDLVSTPDEIIKRVLGLEKNRDVMSGVNYQKISLNPENAIATVEFDSNIYSKEDIESVVSKAESRVVFSNEDGYFETQASYYINRAIEQKENLLYIEYYKEGYKTILVNVSEV